ncbi:hypothetical protein [Butyrivibrio sp. AE3004]|uniref:hypothetical protein n=1 Tax=Butyrivibrio sp. AE3004 TaxID=1506994 RepID=UPI000493D60C|nr:hypothetical protein [Butyrivibrio sp. AE3004]
MTISKNELINKNIEKKEELKSNIENGELLTRLSKASAPPQGGAGGKGEKSDEKIASQIKKNLSMQEEETEFNLEDNIILLKKEESESDIEIDSEDSMSIHKIPVNTSKFSKKPPINQSQLVAGEQANLINEAVKNALKNIRHHFVDNGTFRLRNNGLVVTEKSSVTAKQLHDAIREAETFFKNFNEDQMPAYSTMMGVMLRLSEAANSYRDAHRGWRGTKYGDRIKELSVYIRNSMDQLFSVIDVSEGRKEERQKLANVNVAAMSKDEIKGHQNAVEELNDYYKEWALNYANNETLTDREKIRAKYLLFLPYEKDLEVYKRTVRRDKWLDVVKQYEHYKMLNRVFEKAEKKNSELKQDDVSKEITRHAHDNLEKKEEKNISIEGVNEGLSAEQLKGIEEIDKWFIKNAFNGGLMGKAMSSRKNNNSDIITKLLAKTKRERLFIYYLIETGARKNAGFIDVINSQTGRYIPKLSKFTDQMYASKLKILTHIRDGGYTYMHKLCEAMQVNSVYKDFVKDCPRTLLELNRPVEEEEDDSIIGGKEQNLEPEELINKNVEKRKKQLVKTFQAVQQAENAAKRFKEASGKTQKAARKAEYDSLMKNLKKELRKLSEADDEVGEACEKYNIKEKIGFKPQLTGFNSIADANASGGLGLKVAQVVSKNSDYALKWFIPEKWLYLDKFVGADVGANVFSYFSNLLGGLAALYSLASGTANMHAGDIGEKVVKLINSVVSGGLSVGKAIDTGTQNLQFFREATKGAKAVGSEALKTAGIVTASVGIALGTYTMASAGLDGINSLRASSYLSKKKKKISLIRDDESEDQDVMLLDKEEQKKKAEEKEKEKEREKQIKYEQNMIKLSHRIAGKKATAGFMAAGSATIGLVSIFVPGIGAVICAVAGIAAVIASSRVEKNKLASLRTQMFDLFFGMDEFATRIKNMLAAKGKRVYDDEHFKGDLRGRIASAAGFTDIGTACNSIAKKYAEMVCSKLFADIPRWESEDEKNGYIQLVKSFGLPYNKEKKIPSVDALAKKMSGR